MSKGAIKMISEMSIGLRCSTVSVRLGTLYLCVLLNSIVSISFAAPKPGEVAEEVRVFHSAGINTWNQRLLPEFKKVSTGKTREILSEVEFDIVDAGDFNAYSNTGRPRIILPVGLIIMINNMADAFSVILGEPHCERDLGSFMDDITRVYSKQVRGDYSNPMPDFAARCGLSSERADYIRHQNYELKTTIIVNTLALVVGHEIGHLVHNDPPTASTTESQAQEYSADSFGLDLASRAGFVPFFGGAALFTTMELLESDKGRSGAGTHPPIKCRGARLFAGAISQSWAKQPNGVERLWGIRQRDLDKFVAEASARCHF